MLQELKRAISQPGPQPPLLTLMMMKGRPNSSKASDMAATAADRRQ
jgi:hypothetical protein